MPILDMLNPKLGGVEGYLNQEKYFERKFKSELNSIKSQAKKILMEKILSKCKKRPTKLNSFAVKQDGDYSNDSNDYIFPNDSMTTIGRVGVYLRDINLEWGAEDFKWTGNLEIQDGAGFSNDYKDDSIEKKLAYPFLGKLIPIFPYRVIIRATWNMKGSSKICCPKD